MGSGPERDAALGRAQTADLVRTADEVTTDGYRDPHLLARILEELHRRQGDVMLAHTLNQRGYLAYPMQRLHAQQYREQSMMLRDLLITAYGPELEHTEFAEVVDGSRADRYQPTRALLART